MKTGIHNTTRRLLSLSFFPVLDTMQHELCGGQRHRKIALQEEASSASSKSRGGTPVLRENGVHTFLRESRAMLTLPSWAQSQAELVAARLAAVGAQRTLELWGRRPVLSHQGSGGFQEVEWAPLLFLISVLLLLCPRSGQSWDVHLGVR